MPYSISLTGWPTNDPIPDTLVEVNFAQGLASSGQNPRTIILIGNKTSSGQATADTVIYGPDTLTPLQDQAGADLLFGSRSPLAGAYRSALAVDQNISVYALAVSESSGAQATGTITFTGNATADGTARIYVGSEFVDISIAKNDTPTTTAANVVTMVMSQQHWPVTATSALGVVTLTYSTKGLYGNWLRYNARILNNTIGMTVSPTAPTFMTGGTTADSYTNALATLSTKFFNYLVVETTDSTNLQAIANQVVTQALPVNGRLQRVVCGSVDSLSNAITISTALNQARVEMVWLADSDVTPFNLAANNTALYVSGESAREVRLSFSNFGKSETTRALWKIQAPRNGAGPTRIQEKTALNNGLTTIGVEASGTTYLVKRITTKCLNGALPDYRIRDAHKVTVCDLFAEELKTKIASQFEGGVIGNDPKDQGQPLPGSKVLTPKRLINAIAKLVDEFGKREMLQNIDEIKSSVEAIRETVPATRMTARVQLQVIDLADQIGVVVNQVA